MLKNVKIEGDDSGNVGGVTEWSYGGKIENCSVWGSVSHSGINSYAGGAVGYQANGFLTGCSSSATVNAGNIAGGVAGGTNSATLTGCYATGSVSGSGSGPVDVGGVTGINACGTMTACYWGSNPDTGIGDKQAGTTGGTEQVTDGNRRNAVTQMNAAMQSAGSEWRYELTGAFPALKKQ